MHIMQALMHIMQALMPCTGQPLKPSTGYAECYAGPYASPYAGPVECYAAYGQLTRVSRGVRAQAMQDP